MLYLYSILYSILYFEYLIIVIYYFSNTFYFTAQFSSKPTTDNTYKDKLKQERFRDCLTEKMPDEIVDDGHIPGDHKGVAGVDTMFWW